MTRFLVVLMLAGALAACGQADVSDFAKEKPVFDVARYFDGTVDGWGMVRLRGGKVVQRFKVRIDGRIDGDRLTLVEHFEYSDGRRERKIWQLDRQGDRYSGAREDTVGEAHGEQAGFAFNLRYVLRVPVDGRSWDLQMDDWMFMIDERSVLNRTQMSKFGIRIGDVTVAFRKRD